MSMGRQFGGQYWALLAALILQAPETGAQWLDQSQNPSELVQIDPETTFKDRKGLIRDTRYFMGYQVATIGILYLMPESVSNWSDEQKEEYSLSTWWDNVTDPQWDSDDHFINYVIHPYWGAAYYVRARERGYAPAQSFWYSVLLSSMYEFGIEALFEEPSKQDLIVTPVAGSALGVYFMHVRNNVRARSSERGYRSRKDKWLWALTDPLGALNRTFDRWFGWDGDVSVQPYASRRAVHSGRMQGAGGLQPEELEWEAGVLFRVSW